MFSEYINGVKQCPILEAFCSCMTLFISSAVDGVMSDIILNVTEDLSKKDTIRVKRKECDRFRILYRLFSLKVHHCKLSRI